MFSNKTFLSLAILTVLVSSVLMPTSFGMKGAYPGENGLIAFTAHDDSDIRQIFIMNAYGTGIQQITFDEDYKYDPCWSPDSEKLAFRKGISTPEIYYILKNGTGLTQVTTCPTDFMHRNPAWSPDGEKIAYSRYHYFPPYERDVYVIQLGAGGEGVKLIEGAESPSWSPDGTMIAYWNVSDSKIWVADSTTGTPIHNVTSAYGSSPCWSPDGQRITYQDTNQRICVIDVDGTNQQQISDPPAGYEDEAPNWSPDGSKILFCRDEDSIWIMNADGTDAYDLTPTYPEAIHPDWARAESSVGGEIISVTTFQIIMPYLAATIILITGATAVLFKKGISNFARAG